MSLSPPTSCLLILELWGTMNPTVLRLKRFAARLWHMTRVLHPRTHYAAGTCTCLIPGTSCSNSCATCERTCSHGPLSMSQQAPYGARCGSGWLSSLIGGWEGRAKPGKKTTGAIASNTQHAPTTARCAWGHHGHHLHLVPSTPLAQCTTVPSPIPGPTGQVQ
jgi:hypothetical protein